MRRDQPADDPPRSPTYVVDGVVHYCVTNMPGAVGRTSTYALCNVTLPYVLQIARHGWRRVAGRDPGVAEGVNIDQGRVTNQAVAATFGLPMLRWDLAVDRPELRGRPGVAISVDPKQCRLTFRLETGPTHSIGPGAILP